MEKLLDIFWKWNAGRLFFILLIHTPCCHPLHIHNEVEFIAQHRLPESTEKNLTDLFTIAQITNADLGTQGFCTKLASVGFKLIKKSAFADSSQQHANIIAQCPAWAGHFFLKAEGLLSKINAHSSDNIQRIILADAINTYATKHNFKHIYAPRKYLFHIPGAEQLLIDKNYLVLAQTVEINPTKKWINSTPEQARELTQLMLEFSIFDIRFIQSEYSSSYNTVFDISGAIALLDTEPLGQLWTEQPIHNFSAYGISRKPYEGIIANHLILQGIQLHDPILQAQGKQLLQYILTLHRGLFPLYSLSNRNPPVKRIIVAAMLECCDRIDAILSATKSFISSPPLQEAIRCHDAVWLKEYVSRTFLPFLNKQSTLDQGQKNFLPTKDMP